MNEEIPHAFWEQVDRSDPGGCWLWAGPVWKDRGRSRGVFRMDGKYRFAHRIACEARHGSPLTRDLVTRHSCDNSLCVNPDHLEWGTQLENIKDRVLRRRTAGATNSHCKHGHIFDEANTRVRRDGMRVCKTCSRERLRKHRLSQQNVRLSNGGGAHV